MKLVQNLQRRDAGRACLLGGQGGARSVRLSLIVESSDLLPTFAFLDLRHLGKEWLISSDD